MHAPPGVPGVVLLSPKVWNGRHGGGEFSDWNRMLYKSSPFNRRPDTHTHTTIHYNRSQQHQFSSPLSYMSKLSRMASPKIQHSTKTKAVDAKHLAVIAAAAKKAETKKIAAVSNAIPTHCPLVLPKILPTTLSIT